MTVHMFDWHASETSKALTFRSAAPQLALPLRAFDGRDVKDTCVCSKRTQTVLCNWKEQQAAVVALLSRKAHPVTASVWQAVLRAPTQVHTAASTSS